MKAGLDFTNQIKSLAWLARETATSLEGVEARQTAALARGNQMAKLTKKLIEARINRAVIGFQIPMMSIPKLYARLEHAVRSDMDDTFLSTIVAEWPGVARSD